MGLWCVVRVRLWRLERGEAGYSWVAGPGPTASCFPPHNSRAEATTTSLLPPQPEQEVHYNQHGLLLLDGKGVYRLADKWYPVQVRIRGGGGKGARALSGSVGLHGHTGHLPARGENATHRGKTHREKKMRQLQGRSAGQRPLAPGSKLPSREMPWGFHSRLALEGPGVARLGNKWPPPSATPRLETPSGWRPTSCSGMLPWATRRAGEGGCSRVFCVFS